MMALGRVPWRRKGGRAALAAAAAAVALALCARCPMPVALHANYEWRAVRPHDVAHLLADFSTHPNVGHWTLEQENSNYTSWQYSVRYECGARCEGRATVRAHDEHDAGGEGGRGGGPRHGHAARHVVAVEGERCARPPLLPWPRSCDRSRWRWAVAATGQGEGGTRLRLEASARCAWWRWASGACASTLAEHSRSLLAAVKDALRIRTA